MRHRLYLFSVCNNVYKLFTLALQTGSGEVDQDFEFFVGDDFLYLLYRKCKAYSSNFLSKEMLHLKF